MSAPAARSICLTVGLPNILCDAGDAGQSGRSALGVHRGTAVESRPERDARCQMYDL